MALTDKEIRSLKPAPKRTQHPDGQGLTLDVMPSGKKVFRFAYRFGGKQRTMVIGDYPEISLADARLTVGDLKRSLREGIDPKADKKNAPTPPLPMEPTWAEITKDYLMLRQPSGAAKRTMAKLIRQVELTVEAYGDRLVAEISAEDVLALVNPIAELGHVENAHKVRSRFSQIFRYAGARGLIQYDPAAMTIGAMVKRKRGEFAGVTEPKEVGRLMASLRRHCEENLVIGSALLLSAYTFPRNSELRGMRWDEIDWNDALWSIPAERMKMKRPHLVPLARQTLSILEMLRDFDFGSELVLPSPVIQGAHSQKSQSTAGCGVWASEATGTFIMGSERLPAQTSMKWAGMRTGSKPNSPTLQRTKSEPVTIKPSISKAGEK